MLTVASRPIILCVEDEPALLRDLCEVLQEAGYDAIGAPDVAHARQVLMRVAPALIVCDITMPGTSGIDFMADLRSQDSPLSGVPFMLLTALSQRDDVLRGKWAGADDYLVKPVDYDMLLASIASRLAQMGRMQTAHESQLRRHVDELQFQWTNVLDKISQCALVCDAALGVRFANRAAYSLCRSPGADSSLSVDMQGRMVLHPAIVNHPDIKSFLAGGQEAVKVDLPRPAAGKKMWQVSLLAMGERGQAQARSARGETFVVFLSDTAQRQLHNKAALARRFSLTPTEVQVASLLTDGMTKQEMSAQMNVSAATMAYHLRNLFGKTGTKRQAELVALLMSVAWNDIMLPTPQKV